MPHEDGPLYKPHFVIISLGSSLLLEFFEKNSEENPRPLEERKVCSVLLEPGSCLIISEDAYLSHLHGISERTSDLLDDKVCNLHLIDPALREQKVKENKERRKRKIDMGFSRQSNENFEFR